MSTANITCQPLNMHPSYMYIPLLVQLAACAYFNPGIEWFKKYATFIWNQCAFLSVSILCYIVVILANASISKHWELVIALPTVLLLPYCQVVWYHLLQENYLIMLYLPIKVFIIFPYQCFIIMLYISQGFFFDMI